VPLQVFNQPFFRNPFTNQHFITGIGRHSAIALSNAGWNVVLTARRLSALLETSEMLKDPSACLTIAGDISDASFVKNIFQSTIDKFGEPFQ
jgi:NADP-dependent 3-hydroxy acid dehydrogenase YdfG